MRKYVGTGYVPGVPARDLTEDEYRHWVNEAKAGRAAGIVEGSPQAELWKKEKEADETQRSHEGRQRTART